MNEAFNLIKAGGSLVAINKSRYYKSEKGLSIGTGAFVSALGNLIFKVRFTKQMTWRYSFQLLKFIIFIIIYSTSVWVDSLKIHNID